MAEPKGHYLELGIEFCLELAIGLYQLGAEQMDLPHNFWVGLGLWVAATALALRMFWIFPGIGQLNPRLKVAIASIAVSLLIFISWTPVTSAYKKSKGHDLSARHDLEQSQEPQQAKPEERKKDEEPKKQEAKSKPRPKAEQPTQDNHVGSVEQGPCSNLQIGGSGNQATTNCGAAVVVIYSYNGSVKKTVSGGRTNMNVSQPDARLLKIVEKMSAGYNSEALADATTLMANEPQWATPHVEAAFAYINLGNLDAAKAELKKARDLAPTGYEYEEDYAPHFQHLEEAIKRHEPAPS